MAEPAIMQVVDYIDRSDLLDDLAEQGNARAYVESMVHLR
jgi:hypothetical protein